MNKEQFIKDMLNGRDCGENCGACQYCHSRFCRTERQSDFILQKYFERKAPNKDQVMGVVQRMLDKFGEDSQIEVAIEEMAELTKELIKYMRSKIHEQEKTSTRRNKVVEEMGDVMLMFQYLKTIFDITEDELLEIVAGKAERTQQRYLEASNESIC